MGQIRIAKDGHLYERRRTYGGRFYTVQHGNEPTSLRTSTIWGLGWLFGLLFAPVTFGISLPVCLFLAACCAP